MNRGIHSRFTVVAGTFTLAALAWSGQLHGRAQPEPNCAALQNDTERLACYDARERQRMLDAIPVAKPEGRSTKVAPERAERPQPPAAGSNDDFGKPQPQIPRGRELVDRIASIHFNEVRERYITLENGQVWKQVIDKRYELRAGQTVRIYPTRWGSDYRLSVEDLNGFIQVQRIE